MNEARNGIDLEELELDLLLTGLHQHYGVDLRDYTVASLKRRVRECMHFEEVQTLSGLQEKVLHDAACLERLLFRIASQSTTLFRDPSFFLTLRERVIPQLRTYPFVRIWVAGCAQGEDVYAIAILLAEAGLTSRCRIYATDISRQILQQAKLGSFPLQAVQEYTTNYLRAGGTRLLSEYYTVHEGMAYFHPDLHRNVTFSEHNLVTDGSFNEFHMVLCRNVMIYFNKNLQERVHELIYESLNHFGILGLGSQESLRLSPREAFYELLDRQNRIYRKVL